MSNKKYRIFLSPPALTGKEMQYLSEALDEGYLAPSGPKNSLFEDELAKFTKSNFVLSTSSGSSALHLAYLCAGLKRGDEVWCSDLTFFASASPSLMLGLKIVFVDADPETFCIDAQLLADELRKASQKNKLPKALVVTHLFGNPSDLIKIKALADEYDVILIEDAAESLGSTFNDVHTGTIGDFGVLSFNGNKIITTTAGGALICSKEKHLSQASSLANHGRLPGKSYIHNQEGYNYQMSNVLASIGLAQLTELKQRVEGRRNNFRLYETFLGKLEGVTLQKEYPGALSNRWLNTIVFDSSIYKENTGTIILEKLESNGIEARPMWKPMHCQPVFKGCRFMGNGISENLERYGVCLPSGNNLSDDEIKEISDLILDTIKKG